jgi:hypothetical protein
MELPINIAVSPRTPQQSKVQRADRSSDWQLPKLVIAKIEKAGRTGFQF